MNPNNAEVIIYFCTPVLHTSVHTTGNTLIAGNTVVGKIKITDKTTGIQAVVKEGQPLNRAQWDAASTIESQELNVDGNIEYTFTAPTTVATIGWVLTGFYSKFGVEDFITEYEVTQITTDELYGIDGGDFDIDRPPANLEYPTPITFPLGQPVSFFPTRVDGLDLVFSAMDLPPGISIDSETGELTGPVDVRDRNLRRNPEGNGVFRRC